MEARREELNETHASLDVSPPPGEDRSIAAIVGRFRLVRTATANDNAEILRFLKNQPMQTKDMAIGFDRGDDFFAFYRQTTKHFETFLFLNEDGSIGGLGSLLFQDLVLNGKTERVGYFCDLRVDPKASPATHLEWRLFYADLVRGLRTLPDVRERCSFIYTSVFDTNERAIRALTKKLKGVRYVPFHAYRTRSLLMDPLGRLLPAASAVDLSTDGPRPDFAVEWKTSPTSAVVVTSKSGLVLASARPWRSDGVRQPIINGLSRALRLLGRLLPLLGRPAVIEGRPLKQSFLTQLRFAPGLSAEEKSECLGQMVRAAYRRAVKDRVHLISWIESADVAADLPGATCFTTAAKLYEVVSTDHQSRAPEFLDTPVSFEGAVL